MARRGSFGISVIITVLATAISFIVLMAIFSFSIIIAVISALITFLIFAFITRPKGRKPGFSSNISEVKDPQLREVLVSGHEKQNTLKQLKLKISKREIRTKVDKIIEVVEKIFEDFKEDPKDMKTGRQFLNYYLDSTIKIITRYSELASKQIKDVELETTLNKTEELLDTVYHSFEEQLAKLQQNDVMDLDTEIKLLEQTLKMEGLDKRSMK